MLSHYAVRLRLGFVCLAFPGNHYRPARQMCHGVPAETRFLKLATAGPSKLRSTSMPSTNRNHNSATFVTFKPALGSLLPSLPFP